MKAVRTLLLSAALVALSFGRASGAAAQQPSGPPPLDGRIREAYAPLEAATVRIRTVARIPVRVEDPRTGLDMVVDRALTAYGTGVVIGEIHTGERWEYLILTNHHVADVSNYVIPEGRFFRQNLHNTRGAPAAYEESHLIATGASGAASEIRLVDLARDVRGDASLLRTDHVDRVLSYFAGPIGYAGDQVQAGSPVVTSGFRLSGALVVAVGRVLQLDRPHQVGLPHEDHEVDLPVEPGQSGSPVFLAEVVGEGAEPEIRFTLIGLLHARDRSHQLVAPYPLWKGALEVISEPLRQRLVP